MEERRVGLDLALLAKEKGFEVEGSYVYREDKEYYEIPYWEYRISNNDIDPEFYTENNYICTAPTQEVLKKWILKEHSIYIDVSLYDMMNLNYGYNVSILRVNDDKTCELIAGVCNNDDYEQALENGLIAALEIIE